ncbi:MAG: hypothetical protein U0836_17995 [Pirellulales bacterium]
MGDRIRVNLDSVPHDGQPFKWENSITCTQARERTVWYASHPWPDGSVVPEDLTKPFLTDRKWLLTEKARPGDRSFARAFWKKEATLRIKGITGLYAPDFFCLTRGLIALAESLHVAADPLWEFYVLTTKNCACTSPAMHSFLPKASSRKLVLQYELATGVLTRFFEKDMLDGEKVRAVAFPDDATPRWDATLRTLFVCGEAAKQFRQPAEAQTTLLSAFQEEEWTSHIDNPLGPKGGTSGADRARNAVEKLNAALKESGLRFSMDGTGEGIYWSVEKAAAKQRQSGGI